MTLKIATIIGARPQFIKAAVVSRALKQYNSSAQEIIIHTGQHFDTNMSDIFFEELDIPVPSHHLGIGGGTHGQNTGRMLEKIEAVLIAEKPHWVLVYGDTDSTLAGALAASKLHIPVAHVEAGLRSFNRRMPEEINRILTDHVSSLLLTPTETATRNLGNEGITGGMVKQIGDVMYDAALYYGQKSENNNDLLERLKIRSKDYVLVTLHRAENVDDRQRMDAILKAFKLSGRKFIWPMHPRTKKRLEEFVLPVPANVQIVEPVGYLDMVLLERHAQIIATDSGGVQKEAYFHRVPCVTLREETEWVELVTCGANVLVGADTARITGALSNDSFISGDSFQNNLYGDGNAGLKVVETIAGHAQQSSSGKSNRV